jgi:protein arginine kinase
MNTNINNSTNTDVVISSRVRLARNLKNFPFPAKMTNDQRRVVIDTIKNAFFSSNFEISNNFSFVDILALDPIDKQVLVEKHLISPDLASNKLASGAIISNDETISIMINEEDHLRIQCIYPGFNIDTALDLCYKLDTLLNEKIEFAYNDKYGYLTSCPTNLGTALRTSVMVHLPALSLTGYLTNILESSMKLGLTVRGIFGENTQSAGDIYQVSNQKTLGQTEEWISKNVINIATQIVEQERFFRNELSKKNPLKIEDRLYRALGLLHSARIISVEESLKLLSDVKLGVDIGIIKNIKIDDILSLMLLILPGCLQKSLGKLLTLNNIDSERANLIRNILNSQI